jgi:hypothetical protein
MLARKHQGKVYFVDTNVKGRLIIKYSSDIRGSRIGLIRLGLRILERYCGHGNEPLGSTNAGDILTR